MGYSRIFRHFPVFRTMAEGWLLWDVLELVSPGEIQRDIRLIQNFALSVHIQFAGVARIITWIALPENPGSRDIVSGALTK